MMKHCNCFVINFFLIEKGQLLLQLLSSVHPLERGQSSHVCALLYMYVHVEGREEREKEEREKEREEEKVREDGMEEREEEG